MSAGWEVGDLAWQDDSLPYCAACEEDESPGDLGASDGVLTVVCVTPPDARLGEGHCGLRFATDISGDEPWCACIFRKIVNDEQEACEPEFVTLLKRSKQRADA